MPGVWVRLLRLYEVESQVADRSPKAAVNSSRKNILFANRMRCRGLHGMWQVLTGWMSYLSMYVQFNHKQYPSLSISSV
jgi:hypothetical protein